LNCARTVSQSESSDKARAGEVSTAIRGKGITPATAPVPSIVPVRAIKLRRFMSPPEQGSDLLVSQRILLRFNTLSHLEGPDFPTCLRFHAIAAGWSAIRKLSLDEAARSW
jgi:hypothetical protein